jgi:hypothetical protein
MKTRSEARKEREQQTTDGGHVESIQRGAPTPEEAWPEGEPKKTGYDFPSANKARGKAGDGVRPDLDRIVEEVFVRDLYAEWKELEAGLTVGEKRSEHAYAVRELDLAASRAYRAHRLYLTARAAREEWEAENETIFGAMVAQAHHELEVEKEAGTRKKQITDADIRSKVATLFPDEWQAQERKRRKVELTVKSLERLAEIWFNKCADLRAGVGKQR